MIWTKYKPFWKNDEVYTDNTIAMCINPIFIFFS